MIENIKRYQDDFKGDRVPVFERKYSREGKVRTGRPNRSSDLKYTAQPGSPARLGSQQDCQSPSAHNASLNDERNRPPGSKELGSAARLDPESGPRLEPRRLIVPISSRRNKTTQKSPDVIDRQLPPDSLFSAGGLFHRFKKQQEFERYQQLRKQAETERNLEALRNKTKEWSVRMQ